MPQKTVSLSKKCILDTDHVSLILQDSPQVQRSKT